MKETERIASLFIKLYNGSPWIDVNITESLSGLSASQASKRVFRESNTIWEIVNHMISWRWVVLQRIQGNIISSPDHNYFEPVEDMSDHAWETTLVDLQKSQTNWLSFLEDFDLSELRSIYPGNNMNYYEHIHGILQHDAYHLGQIRLLMKFL